MRLKVFGKMIEIIRRENRWKVYYVGAEGKKRPATDIVIPPDLAEDELPAYVADLCHEWQTRANDRVEVLKS